MPLDVQPLSPQRRAVMLLVLLGLLGASLGFANWLVVRRQPPAPIYRVIFSGPSGLTDPVPAWESVDGVFLTGSGHVKEFGGHIRQFAVLSYEADVDAQVLPAEALSKFTELSNEQPERTSRALVAGLPAVHLEGQYGEHDEANFTMLRLTAVPGKVVGICYSGQGTLTDADRVIFEGLCRSVAIQRVVRAK
jgi:hypothetical protein